MREYIPQLLLPQRTEFHKPAGFLAGSSLVHNGDLSAGLALCIPLFSVCGCPQLRRRSEEWNPRPVGQESDFFFFLTVAVVVCM